MMYQTGTLAANETNAVFTVITVEPVVITTITTATTTSGATVYAVVDWVPSVVEVIDKIPTWVIAFFDRTEPLLEPCMLMPIGVRCIKRIVFYYIRGPPL